MSAKSTGTPAGGAGTSSGGAVALIAKTVTQAATGANTDPTTLWAFTLPAGSLATAGDLFRISVSGSLGANANNKTIEILLNGDVIAAFSTSTPGASWGADIECFYTAADSSVAITKRFFSASGGSVTTLNTGTLNFAANQSVIVRGTNGSAVANDIVFRAGSATTVK